MKKKANAEKFENRVRFNWGYHDAAQAVRQGWDNPAHNFGFAQHGPLAGLTGLKDLLARHFDRTYAQGWQAGYHDAMDGTYANDSSEAWNVALSLGLVSV